MNELTSAKQELKKSKILYNENRTIKMMELKALDSSGKEITIGYMKLDPSFIERIKRSTIGHY